MPVILNSDQDTLTLARWGLVPLWAKEEKIGYKMINARAETIFEKPAYRSSIKNKRCLIPADCFYEWKKEGAKKQPWCIRLKSQETFTFAGIWDCWQDELITCSIITCAPNALMAPIHDRMPVILKPEDEPRWLGDDFQSLLKACSPAKMEVFPISLQINSPSNNTPEIIKPV